MDKVTTTPAGGGKKLSRRSRDILVLVFVEKDHIGALLQRWRHPSHRLRKKVHVGPVVTAVGADQRQSTIDDYPLTRARNRLSRSERAVVELRELAHMRVEAVTTSRFVKERDPNQRSFSVCDTPELNPK